MEQQRRRQQQQQQQQLPPPYPQPHHSQEDANAGNNGATSGGLVGTSKSSLLCRQSSTRWIPTTDQIRILKDLYYNSGVRSPSAEQIQRISARLRQYGKIEGKNVFYWFQNHKARERQKKRLTVDVPTTTNNNNNKFSTTTLSPGVSPTSSGVYGVAHHHVGTFRDCSLTSGVGGSNVIDCSSSSNSMGWLGVDAASSMPQYYYHQQHPRPIYYYEDSSNCYYHYNHQYHQLKKEEHIETLPLFPIHSQEQKEEQGENARDYESHSYCHAPYLQGHQPPDPQVGHVYCNGNDASLELTLNSYHSSHP